MQRTIYLLSIALLLPFAAVVAQQQHQDQITVENLSISKKADRLSITFDLNLDGLHLDKNNLLVVTPQILSAEGEKSVNLEPLAIKGSLRSKILDRPFTWKGKPDLPLAPERQVVRKNGTAQSLHYEITTPFDEWQRKAQLLLKTEVIGCADCRASEPDKKLADKLVADRFEPRYRISYIVPEVEEVKQRSETYSAHLNYAVGKSELLPNFGNNASELAKVDGIVTELKGDNDLTITDFTISGYASPEGSEQSNMLLSQKRAEAFAAYIEKKYGYPHSNFKVKWFGEDWKGLREAVAASSLSNREAILQVIDSEPSLDARDAKLKAIDNSVTYKRLLDEFYPPLRRNDYNIAFVSRAFNVEEASKMIKSRPKLLSLNEMFLVAETYEVDSPQYREVFDIAARTFPESVIANLNVAVSELRANNPDAALARLQKIEENADTWNLMGVAHTMKGNTTQANELFDRAARAGHAEAKHNLEQLEQYIKDSI